MTILAFEGFDGINSSADLIVGPFNSVLGGTNPTIDSGNARTGAGKCIGLNGATTPGMQLLKATGSSGQSITVGAAMVITSGKAFLGVYNGTTCQASFACDASGVLTVYRGLPATGVLLGTAPTIALASVYNYFEFQVTAGTGTAGSFTARVNGITVLNLASLNTSVDGTPIINQIGVGSTFTGGGNAAYMDDLYICDSNGGTPGNNFLGDVHVSTMFPNGNNSVSWVPVGGSNFQAVSETAMDADSSYTSTSVPGQTDLFSSAGLSITPTTIYGVQVKLATRMEAAGADLIAGVVTSGNIQQVGTGRPVLTNYTYVGQVFTTDPSTSAAWTKAGVNAAYYGYKRIS